MEMKKKKFKFLSVVISVAMMISSISFTVAAVSFDDVESDSTVAWAKQSINKMTEAGYIKGYEDGTFRPFRPITKIECLILMSRMLGLEDERFSDIAAAAKDEYKETASKYNSTYANELSYLLYCGVLQESNLTDYASAANANTQLLRYQAAMLMAKLMGADSEAKAYSVAMPTYADNDSIPANAKPYVEYVTKGGIMNGMDADESGQPQFSPTTSITRAQIATLLERMMGKLSLSYVTGTVSSISSKAITAGGSRCSVTDGTMVYSDGSAASTSDISNGDVVSIVSVCGNALAIAVESSDPSEITTVYGVVLRKSESADGQKITIADYEDKDTNATYTLRSGCDIKVNGNKANIGDIKEDAFVKLELRSSKVTSISTEEKTLDVSGTLISTEYDDDDHLYLNVGDKDGKSIQNYVVSTKGASVTRDGSEVEFRQLSAGDSVKLKLTYGKVTRVTATSSSSNFSGLLTEITLSSNPSITISSNGKTNTYKLRSDAKVTVAGNAGTIYDLRPNTTVTGVLDSNEVRSISAASVSVNEKGEMTGTVTGKNTTYNVITLRDEDGNSQSVYYNSKTTFLNSSGNNVSVKSIETGSKISVTGADKNGVFEATIVIVK